jgi:hypothetical protein
MRTLTLILSDVYLPEESDRAISTEPHTADALPMPHLEWLLRFASRPQATRDWRAWLAGTLGFDHLRDVPPAQVAARDLLPADLAGQAWFATPVYFDLHINHVRLNARGMLRIDAAEGGEWCAAFARDFGPDYALHYGGPRGFLLTGLRSAGGPTLDPARLLGADVTPGLRQAGDLVRLELARAATEFEFWMHASPLNAAREGARRPRISSFWLWGGGASVASGAARSASRAARLFGDDLFLRGLARDAGSPAQPAPAEFDGLPADAADAIVELMPMSGPAEQALAKLEARWFAPMRAALARGVLDRVELVANDRCWRIDRGGGWKFWRRPRDWLAALQA